MWFVIGAAGSLLLLSLCAMFLKWGAKRLKKQRSTKLSLALNNLHRPGASTNSVVLSLGLGLAVLVAIALIESNLTRQVDDQLPDMAPAFFLLIFNLTRWLLSTKSWVNSKGLPNTEGYRALGGVSSKLPVKR